MNITGSMYKWGFEKNSEPTCWVRGCEISEPCCKVRRSFHYPCLGGGGRGGLGKDTRAPFCGLERYSRVHFWRELEIPWPMCRKEETPRLMWKEGGGRFQGP